MRQGTEVEIMKVDEQPDGAVAVELVGQRTFQLLGDPWLQEAGDDGDPAPAPLSSVAAATQDTSKFIAARVEFARDSEDGVGSSMAGSGEEIGLESEKMLDKLTGEADYESNLQMSAGSRYLEAASVFSHGMIQRWRGRGGLSERSVAASSFCRSDWGWAFSHRTCRVDVRGRRRRRVAESSSSQHKR